MSCNVIRNHKNQRTIDHSIHFNYLLLTYLLKSNPGNPVPATGYPGSSNRVPRFQKPGTWFQNRFLRQITTNNIHPRQHAGDPVQDHATDYSQVNNHIFDPNATVYYQYLENFSEICHNFSTEPPTVQLYPANIQGLRVETRS